MATNNAINTGKPIEVSNGGTGASSFTAHSLLLGQGSSAMTALGAATNGQLPIGSTGADPVLASLTQPAAGITITGGAGSITFALANDLLAVENLSTNGIATRTATSTWTTRTITGTSNQVSVSNGDGVSGNPTLSLPSTIVTPGYINFNSGTTTGIANGASGSIFSYSDNQQYYVTINAPGSNPIARAAAIVVSSSGLFQTTNFVASLCSITISGSTVQITNSAGGTLAFNWSCLRVF